MTKKSIKVLAASTVAITSIGVTSVLTSADAFASSITQKSGDENKGKLEVVTNPFTTFEKADNFMEYSVKPLLKGESYKTSVLPTDPTGYVVNTLLDYDALTSKSKAEELAHKLIASADSAITENISSDKPADKPTDKPADKPTDKPTDKPADKPTDKPADNPTDKPADNPTDKPADNPTDKPADNPTNKPADNPTDKLTDKKEIAKTEKSNKGTNTTETQKDIGKEVLPNTGESFSNSVLLGSILALFGLAITYKFKLSKK